MADILGIVAEYNPLHAGHLYQLQTAKKETGCNTLVVAMSGNFVQRGEPALVNKWIRTEMALAAGVDLVIEIPTALVLNSAEGFARAGVGILAACGVNVLSFGSESGSITNLKRVAASLNTKVVQSKIAPLMKRGINYARAVQLALGNTCPDPALVSSANNILGLEYLRAIAAHNLPITSHTVRRIGSGHGSLSLRGYSSATAIRQAIREGIQIPKEIGIPPEISAPLTRALANHTPAFSQDLAPLIFDRLRRPGAARELAFTRGIGEGLENRIVAAATETNDLEDLIARIKTKRYPRTRIQRILFSLILNLSQADLPELPYLRVLGFSSRGRALLTSIAARGQAPLLVTALDCRSLPGRIGKILDVDLLAASIHSVAGKYPFKSDLSFAPVFKGSL